MNNLIQKFHLAIFTLLFSITIHAQIDLHGNLLYDTKAPVPNTLVMADAARGTTDSGGQFVLRLPADVKAGQRVMVRVSKDGYLIDKPLDGLWNASNRELQGIQPFTVIIVRKGSLTLLSDARLNQMMDQFKDNFTRQISSLRMQIATNKADLAASKQEIAALKAQVLPDMLGQWQQEYALSAEQIKVVLDKYANTKNPADDFRAQALKEYYNGNFEAASSFFEKAALAKEDDITRKEAELELDKLAAFNNWKDSGKAKFSNDDFSAALTSYNLAAKHVIKERHPQQWAELENLFGVVKQSLGSRTDGATVQRFLIDAVKHHQNALSFYTQNDWLVEWANTQCYLGIAKTLLAQRTTGESRAYLIEEAVAAYQAVLQGHTNLLFPTIWSDAQHYLGSVLIEKGKDRYDEFGKKFLSQAATAFRQSLEIRKREHSPIAWASTKNNLGIALMDLSACIDDDNSSTQFLTEAINELREALLVRTQESLPYEWATTQNNLGNALSQLAEQNKDAVGIQLLAEAASAYKKALLVRTRENLPKDWADTQDNLASVLLQQGKRTSGELKMKSFLESVSASSLALKIYTIETFPNDWAIAQRNLGHAQHALSNLVTGDRAAQLLADAVAAYRAALQVYTQKDLPRLWAGTQNDLGAVLWWQGERGSGNEAVKLLGDSVAAYRAALQVRTQKDLPQDWAETQKNLGIALRSQGERSSGNEAVKLLGEAVASSRAALQVYTQKDLPQDWAGTQNDLGNALSSQGERSSGNESVKLLGDSVAAYRAALQVYTQKDLPQQWAKTQQNLAGAFFLLEDWGNAAACYTNVFGEHQGIEEVNTRLSGIFHERIFKFAEAFALTDHRVKLDAEDLSAQSDFAETHFTTARFGEAETRINALLANPKVEVSTKAALRAIQIANGLALGKSATVNLNGLIALIAAQPADFQVGWSFRGTLHFIETNDKFTANRAWLQQLFPAFENEKRDAILKKLRALPPVK